MNSLNNHDFTYEGHTEPAPRTFNFVNIIDPTDAKSAIKKRVVRSHAAFYQHRKARSEDRKEPSTGRGRGHKKRQPILANTASIRLETTDVTLDPSVEVSSSKVSSVGEVPKGQNTNDRAPSDTETAVFPGNNGYLATARPLPMDPTFSATKLDPFQIFPIPWHSNYQLLVDNYFHMMIDTPRRDKPGMVPLSQFAPFVISSPAIFYSALAFSAGLYNKMSRSPIRPTIPLVLRQKAISAINEVISDRDRCNSDEAIGAVYHLAIYDFLHDLSSFHIHMRGIAKMVELRGGFNSLGVDGALAMAILWLDTNYAKSHDTTVHFSDGRIYGTIDTHPWGVCNWAKVHGYVTCPFKRTVSAVSKFEAKLE